LCFFIRIDEMSNVFPYINIHTHHEATKDELSIYNIPDNFDLKKVNQFVSIGIHPWNIQRINSKECIDFIRKNAAAKNVLAIGECGLDKLVETNLQIQEELFKQQISISESVKKPMIIHCVKAFDDLIRIKKELNIQIPLIVHGYNNNKQIAGQLVQNNFFISFGKALLKKDSNASKIISTIPIEKVFLETDDTDIPIKSIFEKAATYLQMDVQSLKEKINSNFKQIFTYE
jgi:TatD DNase family protein